MGSKKMKNYFIYLHHPLVRTATAKLKEILQVVRENSRKWSINGAACFACALLLAGCSPKYDWREVHGTNISFRAVLPGKPALHTRPVDLGGIRVPMTMAAADVDDVTFAIGVAELPDAIKAVAALPAMKAAMVRNIGGSIRRETASAAGTSPMTIDIEAIGNNGLRQQLLIARFIAQDTRVYQLIVVGREKNISREAVDTFFTSFKPT